MRKTLNFVIPVAACFLAGLIASLLQQHSLEVWYPQLAKPAMTPPNWVFPLAWSTLYLMMGLSLGFVLNTGRPERRRLVVLFGFQLLFNFLWSICFFYLQSPLLGLVDIIILDSFVLAYILRSYRVSRTASLLFVPYILWLLFATYLNTYILLNN